MTPAPVTPAPWALLAELTHACPLHCPYCSNPLELTRRSRELDTAAWTRVFGQAADLGVVQTHLSGGEPLLRPDLETLVAAAHGEGIYTQLVTSGHRLTHDRLAALAAAGLDAVQLSVQDATEASSDRIAGTAAFQHKQHAARIITDLGLPFGLNVVLHHDNIDHLDQIIDLAVGWRADRLELANTQFYGWALRNRDALLPTHDQLRRAHATYTARRDTAGPELQWVLPDYFDGRAKPCMGGWARQSLTVAPDGRALPCPAAHPLDLDFPNVADHDLAWIWTRSPAFNAYRGTSWMREPCTSCPHRDHDHGGCRCQAHALTGDARNPDPACSLTPGHALIQRITHAPRTPTEFAYRTPERPR